MERDSFIMHAEYADITQELSNEEFGLLMRAVFAYQRGEEIPELNPVVKMAFGFIKSRMDKEQLAYEETCKARSEAGKKAMAKRWQQNEKEEVITNDNKNNKAIQVITNDNKPLQTITNDNKPLQTITNDNKSLQGITSDIDIDIDIDTDIDINKKRHTEKKAAKADTRHKRGEYSRVMLSDAEVEKLNNDYGVEETNAAIKFLDEYKVRKGYKCKDDNLTLRKWVFNAVEEEKRKDIRPSPIKQQQTEQDFFARWGVST